MTMTCPCCGAPMSLDATSASSLKSIPLPRVRQCIVRALADNPLGQTTWQLIDAIWEGRNMPALADRTLSVHMRYVRRAVQPFGWQIVSTRQGSSPGVYRLERLP